MSFCYLLTLNSPSHLGKRFQNALKFLYEQMGRQELKYFMYTCKRNKIIIVLLPKNSQVCFSILKFTFDSSRFLSFLCLKLYLMHFSSQSFLVLLVFEKGLTVKFSTKLCVCESACGLCLCVFVFSTYGSFQQSLPQKEKRCLHPLLLHSLRYKCTLLYLHSARCLYGPHCHLLKTEGKCNL